MPFDAPVVACLVKEINAVLPLKIDKIHQPFRDEFHFSGYGSGESFKLLLSLNAQHARIHLFQGSKPNPPQPTPFCMLLRKHFGGSKLVRLEATPFERIIKFIFEVYDPVNGLSTKFIWLELTGKSANLIVCNENNEIIDTWRNRLRLGSGERDLSPGSLYELPATGGRWKPVTLSWEEFATLVSQLPMMVSLEQFLSKHWYGLSTLTTNEIIGKSGLSPGESCRNISTQQLQKLYNTFDEWAQMISTGQYQPVAVYNQEQTLLDYAAFPLVHLSSGKVIKYVDSLNQVVAELVDTRHETNRFQEIQQNLMRQIKQLLEKNRNKLKKQKIEMEEAGQSEDYRIIGELLTIYGYQLPKGLREAKLNNHYDPEGCEISIQLDPSLSAQENAQVYFKKYQKAKKGQLAIAAQITKTEETIEYLESLEVMLLNAATLPDLELVNEEFQEIMEKKKKGLKKGMPGKKEVPPKPRIFITPSGHTILVGRNNLQNDKLTFKMAAPTDWWFHTQKIPGSHVILKLLPGTEADTDSLNYACQLAVTYSKAKNSTKVPVDYTQRKNVKKPPGSKPGFVIYDNFKTAIITPDAEFLKVLKTDPSPF